MRISLIQQQRVRHRLMTHPLICYGIQHKRKTLVFTREQGVEDQPHRVGYPCDARLASGEAKQESLRPRLRRYQGISVQLQPRAAIDLNVPLITNSRLASAFIYAFCTTKLEDIDIKAWGEY